MLLGQIAAISFAQSLFYIAVVLYSPQDTTQQTTIKHKTDRRISNMTIFYTALRYVIIGSVVIPVVLIPTITHTPQFLRILAVPHLALMVPPIVDRTITRDSTPAEAESVQQINTRAIRFIVLCALLVQARTVINLATVPRAGQHLHRHSAVFDHPLLQSAATASARQSWREAMVSLYDHPAVTSVGWDAILCVLNYQIWRTLRS